MSDKKFEKILPHDRIKFTQKSDYSGGDYRKVNRECLEDLENALCKNCTNECKCVHIKKKCKDLEDLGIWYESKFG